jgi:hypothetical protein
MVGRLRVCSWVRVAVGAAGLSAPSAVAAPEPANRPPRPAIQPFASQVEPAPKLTKVKCQDEAPTLQAYRPAQRKLAEVVEPMEIEYVLTRSETIRADQPGAFSRFTSTLGRDRDHYAFSTDAPGNPVLKLDAKAGHRYALTCHATIDTPPVATHGACTHAYQCKERVHHRLPYYVNCDEPWRGTAIDQTALAGDPYGGWAFIRKWGAPGEVDQLAAQGWVLERCETQRMTCVPDKNKLMYEVCPRTHATATSPKDLFERCDISQSPVAIPWEVEAAAEGKAFERVRSGLSVAGDPGASTSPNASFVARTGGSHTVTVSYVLNGIVAAGYGKSLVVRSIASDAAGACPSAAGVVRETVFQARMQPVAWSLWSCEVGEFAPQVKK